MADPTTAAGIAKAGAAPAWDAVKCSLTFCCSRGDYFSDLRDNLKSLGEQMHRLQELKQQVNRQVTEEKQKGPRLREAPAVTFWLDRVKEMKDSVTEVTQEGNEELRKQWKRWLCPKSCCAFNEVGRRVIGKVAEVKELMEKGGKLAPLVERKPPNPVDEWQIGFNPLGLDSKLEEACGYIEDPSAKIIGIHGPGGVGKTTLLKMINNTLHGTEHDFDVVIQAVVSKEGTVKKVQESILDKLEILRDGWKDKSEANRAQEIFEVLRTKKFILLLDDLQEQSNQAQVSRDSGLIEKREDLITVGVPLDGNENGSKVFFTTRSLAVCGRIEADKSIRVDCLPPNEALKLFQSCVGEDTLNSPKISELASTLAAMCHGLPLALVTVGRAMAHKKNPNQWNNAIENAKRHRSNLPGMENDVFPVLKISYDSLSNDRIKGCFLYFSVFWEARFIKKEDLIDMWIAEGFFGESYDINNARRDGEDIIECLKLACLLEIDDSEELVSLHDVIHSMVLWLCSTVNKTVVQENFTEFQDWMDAVRIILWGSKIWIEFINERPSFRQLKTLFVSSTRLNKLPDEFFVCTPTLRVLNLSDNAYLKELPVSIGELKELNYLNLSRTRITNLRAEVKKLKKLQFLVLDGAFHIGKNSGRVISCLLSLQVLCISVDRMHPRVTTTNDEIEFLQMLECLEQIKEISIPLSSNQSVEKLLKSPKLKNCLKQLILLNDTLAGARLVLTFHNFERERQLERRLISMTRSEMTSWKEYILQNNSDIVQRNLETRVSQNDPCPSSRQLDHVQCLHCQNLVAVRILQCSIKNANGLVYAPNLESLEIVECTEMVELIGQVEENLDIFSNLRKLCLTYLPKLKQLCRKALPLICLEKLSVKLCPNLQELPFDSSSAMNLRQITGEIYWWKNLILEPDSLRQVLLPKFVPYYDPLNSLLWFEAFIVFGNEAL